VKSRYKSRFQLEWMPPFGFNNTFAMVICREDAAGFRTLSEAAAARPWRLGVGYEFLQRPDGFPGLARVYGLRTSGPPVTMDLGLLYRALQSRQVGMVAANSTDGMLSVLDAVVLEDDRHHFPPYQCAAVVRAETLGRFPQLRPVLEELAGKLDDRRMRALNYAVDGEHRKVRDVAAAFLTSW
jgi:glycine betaine/choline ABC-type transport system substrate-binding protein